MFHPTIPVILRVLSFIAVAVCFVLIDDRTWAPIPAYAVCAVPLGLWFGRVNGSGTFPGTLLATTPFWALIPSDGVLHWGILIGKAATIVGLFWAGWMVGLMLFDRALHKSIGREDM